MNTRKIDPAALKPSEFHAWMLGAIAPRPIAFVSTMSASGQVNLSPFSFFNAFGSNPPLVIFSPALRGRDAQSKHTLEYIKERGECVVNIVSYSMVQQMSLASSEYPKGVNEFIKAGFTELASEKVNPPRVAESPVQMECLVRNIVSGGEKGGAAQMVIAEIILMHIKENVLGADGKIDPYLIDQVARLGGNWYSRAKEGLFEVPKPLAETGIGVDSLPLEVRNSTVLTGNDLGLLGNFKSYPDAKALSDYSIRPDVVKLFSSVKNRDIHNTEAIHLIAKQLLSKGMTEEAWLLLLTYHQR